MQRDRQVSEKAYSISLFSLEVSDTLLSLGAYDFKSQQHGGNESFEGHPLIKKPSLNGLEIHVMPIK